METAASYVSHSEPLSTVQGCLKCNLGKSCTLIRCNTQYPPHMLERHATICWHSLCPCHTYLCLTQTAVIFAQRQTRWVLEKLPRVFFMCSHISGPANRLNDNQFRAPNSLTPLDRSPQIARGEGDGRKNVHYSAANFSFKSSPCMKIC